MARRQCSQSDKRPYSSIHTRGQIRIGMRFFQLRMGGHSGHAQKMRIIGKFRVKLLDKYAKNVKHTKWAGDKCTL